MKLKLLDLFSGIGGFSLGFEKTGGFETIAFCEKDKFCQKVLRKNWQTVPIYEDIKNLDAREIKADIVTFGIPCQPFSVAGKRKGTSDDRWLWRETLRVVAETKPVWCVFENVEGIINIEGGAVLQQIQKDLEAENFQVQCFVIPASGIGAWHQRKRVWIIANSNRTGFKDRTEQHRWKQTQDKKRINGSSRSDFISNSKSKRSLWTSQSKSSFNEQQRLDNDKKRNRSEIRSKSSRRSEQTSWWQNQSKLFGVPDGISTELDKDRTNRIKALGNSIVPEIAYEIAKAILVAENE